MANVRVYDLSKELGVSNKEVIDAAKHVGISIRSHSSSISEEEARRIKDKLRASKNHGRLPAREEPKEEVKVFRSETGEEVVERRKGNTVVIRRKKKVEEPEPEEVHIQEEKIPVTLPSVEPSPSLRAVQETQEAKLESERVIKEETLPIEEKPPLEVESAEPEVEQKPEVKEGIKEEEPKEEVEKKVKKKGHKVRPKREEIIDEETLEELRRAFRTKLPVRKREYLVEDRRSR